MKETEDFTSKILKSYFEAELRHPQVEQAKERVFSISKRKFERTVFWSHALHQAFWLSALMMSLALGVWGVLGLKGVWNGKEMESQLLPSRVQEAVLVKRLSSPAGPTMIYQKMHHHYPLTVIWVFPREGRQ